MDYCHNQPAGSLRSFTISRFYLVDEVIYSWKPSITRRELVGKMHLISPLCTVKGKQMTRLAITILYFLIQNITNRLVFLTVSQFHLNGEHRGLNFLQDLITQTLFSSSISNDPAIWQAQTPMSVGKCCALTLVELWAPIMRNQIWQKWPLNKTWSGK